MKMQKKTKAALSAENQNLAMVVETQKVAIDRLESELQCRNEAMRALCSLNTQAHTENDQAAQHVAELQSAVAQLKNINAKLRVDAETWTRVVTEHKSRIEQLQREVAQLQRENASYNETICNLRTVCRKQAAIEQAPSETIPTVDVMETEQATPKQPESHWTKAKVILWTGCCALFIMVAIGICGVGNTNYALLPYAVPFGIIACVCALWEDNLHNNPRPTPSARETADPEFRAEQLIHDYSH